ncbi:MAG: hypothetical protein KGI75_13270 [Rhizobiaceae bacterium]|nr:hypothetical protein [Rhizobiaceae bacterium]
MRSALIVTAALFVPTSAAMAQTAEQTVLYMLHGVEDTRIAIPEASGQSGYYYQPLTDGRTGVNVVRPNAGVDQPFVGYEYKQQDGCIISMTLSSVPPNTNQPMTALARLTLDWSKVSAVTLSAPSGPIHPTSAQGLKVTDCQELSDIAKGQCGHLKAGDLSQIWMNVGTQERVSKAFAYFQQTYCKGSAF